MLSYLSKFSLGFLGKLGGFRTMLIVSSMTFGLGFYTSAKFEQSAHVQELEDAVKRTIAQAETVRELDNEILEGYLEQSQRVNEKIVYVNKEVIKYVKDNSACNLTAGAVGLLNHARDRSKLRKATEITDAEKRTPSTITQRAEIESHLECVTRYEQLSASHDALIDWLNYNR